MWVATFEAKLPSPRNSSGFIVATTMASGCSRPAVGEGGVGGVGHEVVQRLAPAPDARHARARPRTRSAMAARHSCAGAHRERQPRRASPVSRGSRDPPRRRRRRRHPELAHQPEQVRPLQAERARGVGAVAAHLVQRRLDEPSLEVADGAVIAERARPWTRRWRSRSEGVSAWCSWRRRTSRNACATRATSRNGGDRCDDGRRCPARARARVAACTKTKGPRARALTTTDAPEAARTWSRA